MPRMSDKETRFWKERLEWSHGLWRQNGLTADSNRAGALAWMNAYRGIVWNEDSWGGILSEDLIEVPTAFWVVNTQMAGMYARHPVVDVTAERPESVQPARLMEMLLNFLIRSRHLGMKRTLNRSLFGALVLPAGVVRHGFTPDVEFFDDSGQRVERYTSARPNIPWIRSVPLWDFRADPQAETFHHKSDGRWCAFRSLLTMSEIDRTQGLIHRQDLVATTSRDLRFTRPFDQEMEGSPPEEDAKLVEIWTIYDLEERKWFALTEGSEKTIREPDDWPIEWDGLPYNWLGFHEQLDNPFPIAPISMIEDPLRERNKVRTLMAEHVKRMRRIIVMNETQIHPDDVDKVAAGELDLTPVIRSRGDSPIQVIPTGDFSQGLLNYDLKCEEDIRRTLGQSLMSQGQRINVESGTEAAAVAAGAQAQEGLLQGGWEDFVGDVMATFGSALQSPGVLTRSFAMPVLGQQDAESLLRELGQGPFNPLQPVDPQSIRGSFLYEIRPGSMAPRNPAEEQRKAVANLEVAGKFGGNVLKLPQLLLDYVVAMDLDPAKVFMSPQQQQATDEIASQQGVAPAAQRQNGQRRPPQGGNIPPQLLQNLTRRQT